MPHFYLHIHSTDGQAQDEEGVDVCSLAEARNHAISGIRSMLSAELFEGTIDFNGRIEIAGTDQKILLIVPFSDAVRVLSRNAIL